MTKNALSQADSSILDIQFILNKLISRLQVYNIDSCMKTPAIPLLLFLYHFKVFSEWGTERQNKKIVLIATAPLGEIFI